MEITYECPGCRAVNDEEGLETRSALVCRACGQSRPVAAQALRDGQLHACALCATEDLYVQKDFPHILGLAIVVVGFVVSSIFWAYYMAVPALGVLLLTAALDVLLYYVVPDVTICYRCLSQYRGAGSNPEGRLQPFDLAIGERYRQERIRAQELRERGAAASSALGPEASPGGAMRTP